MSGSITAKQFIAHPIFALVVYISVCCILPLYCGGVVTLVACAGIMTVFVAILPDQFRGRSGSLVTATCLVVAMWIAAAVITAMTLVGEIR